MTEQIFDVVIIGAGISGMAVAIDMTRLHQNRNFVLLEKGHRVGGTWSDNEYPGCCCDVWSHLYSYSFAPNPDWTREYPTQPEIQRYLSGVANRYSLGEKIRFRTSVEGSVFDPATGIWTTTTRRETDGFTQSVRSRFLVSAVGQLNLPKYPEITGIDKFEGKIMHSARWDKSVDLSGKRVAVIGNGATAIQIIPELAKIAAKVVVFQRSPNWIQPRDDKTIPSWRQALYRYLPSARLQYRASLMDIRESYWHVLVDVDGEAHQTVKSISADLLNSQLPGENQAELREVLKPRYPPGCKRILISDDYYPALGKPHVILETAAIEQVTPHGIRVAGGWNSRLGQHESQEHTFDIIVCATGFQATQFLSPMKIQVSGGESLPQLWKQGAFAYKGISVPGMPNFAVMYGPNTNLGHNSIILMIEAQSAYISRLVNTVATYSERTGSGYLRISPKASTTKAWNDKVQAGLAKSTLASDQCSSWYKSENGIITTNWSEKVVEYQREVSILDWDDFELDGSGAKELRARGSLSWERVKEETQPGSGHATLSSVVLVVGAFAALAFSLSKLKMGSSLVDIYRGY